MTIDIERLREDLIDYYGTAYNSGFPMAVIELSNVESASERELIRMAQDAGIDLERYISG